VRFVSDANVSSHVPQNKTRGCHFNFFQQKSGHDYFISENGPDSFHGVMLSLVNMDRHINIHLFSDIIREMNMFNILLFEIYEIVLDRSTKTCTFAQMRISTLHWMCNRHIMFEQLLIECNMQMLQGWNRCNEWGNSLPEISILRGCSINHPPANPATRKCTCAIWWYIKLFKIGILGNLPIAHDSLWVLEVMFIETYMYGVWSLIWSPKSKPFKIFRVNMYRKKFTQIQ
jgi:hypothetical protein